MITLGGIEIQDREDLRFVIVGHVDHGKSTLIGRLLFDTDSISADRIEEARQASQGQGREFEFAFLLDHLQEEREQAITIDTTQIFFSTNARNYVIIDAPGHVEFLKNMITGASQAEAAVLIVDASRGMESQTRRHAYILSLLGLNRAIIVLNKMDLSGYSAEVFAKLREEVQSFLERLGIQAGLYIPISAKRGDNVARPSNNMDWYQGPTVLEALDSLKGRIPAKEKHPILPLQDIYEIDSKRIAVGRLETGIIREGMEVKLLPEGRVTTVSSIERFLEESHEAYPGESIGITIRDPIPMDRGHIVCEPGSEPPVTSRFQANIFWMAEQGIRKGEEITLRCATQEVLAKIAAIEEKVDSSSLEVLKSNSEKLENLEVGRVLIETQFPIVVQLFNVLEELGRFVLARGEETCAGGIITGLGGK